MLPPHLQERVAPRAPSPRDDGAFVIYWMRIAARVTENPALDVALAAARELKKKVFVYHAVSERYRYASDRLHTYLLEGARDVQRQCAEFGVGYAFHLEREGAREPVLLDLARQASLIVTDFMPVEPFTSWDAEVGKVAPLWRVDASCVAPVFSADAFERASSFREARRTAWEAACRTLYVSEAPPPYGVWLPSSLPFTPLDLQSASIPELVASCDIDHTVAPVHHSPGGTTAALARWTTFRDTKLVHYEFDRMAPLKEGTSRLSPALHFGHLSPFLVAREAAARKGAGATKFLDEFLVWRELAWNFCLHHPKHDTVEALPQWARETLKQHERDGRSWLPSWEQLARAQTGDLLWDAAQRQLLTHGEVHNHVRMTWGKQLLKWTRTAAEALALMIDLNHRFALDGRDPGSYGGILWCLGAFDRPFEPEVPIFGTVRARDTKVEATRFAVSEYERRVHRAARGSPLTVAVVGAGVAGLAAARALKDAGHGVRVFEAAPQPGGRLATVSEGELRFDLGAPYFTVKDERFARWARAWWQERVLTRWNGTIEGEPQRVHANELVRLLGAPGMDAVVKRLSLELDVRFETEVRGLTRDGARWRLLDSEGHALGEFDVAVVATPPSIAAELVDPSSYELGSRLRELVSQPCWSVLAQFPQGTGVAFDGSYSHVGPLGWMGKNSSKPERPQLPGESWVLHASAEWSAAHRTQTPEEVLPVLLEAFFVTTGVRPLEPSFAKAFLWKHASVAKPLGAPCLWDEKLQLAVCGDWLLGNTVEHAFLSGSAAAGRINALPGGPLTETEPPHSPGQQLSLLG
ncbi:MAG: FAD-dependent oxidoreductase [Archangium sp.]